MRRAALWSGMSLVLLGIMIGCGPERSPSRLAIAGGELAAKDQFPSVIRFVWPGADASVAEITVDCTATKIKERLFVTAAHCVSDHYAPKPRAEVLAPEGVDLMYGQEPPYTFRKKIQITAVHLHPSWLAAMKRFKFSSTAVGAEGVSDVALFETAEDVPVSKIELARKRPPVGLELRMVGYGCTDILKASDGRMRFADKLVVETSDVNGSVLETNPVTGKAASPCTADSGGPWIAERNNVQELVGVTSFGDAPWTGSAKTRRHHFARIDGEAGEPAVGSWLGQLLD